MEHASGADLLNPSTMPVLNALERCGLLFMCVAFMSAHSLTTAASESSLRYRLAPQIPIQSSVVFSLPRLKFGIFVVLTGVTWLNHCVIDVSALPSTH